MTTDITTDIRIANSAHLRPRSRSIERRDSDMSAPPPVRLGRMRIVPRRLYPVNGKAREPLLRRRENLQAVSVGATPFAIVLNINGRPALLRGPLGKESWRVRAEVTPPSRPRASEIRVPPWSRRAGSRPS